MKAPSLTRRPRSASLPVFPWDTLAEASELARSHPDGIVDLSVGTPVDPVAPVIREALAAASAAPGYPATAGTPALREAAVDALARRYRVDDLSPDAVLPVIGTKELIAWLPTLLGLGPEDVVVVPELAYPTYEVGARLAGAQVVLADSLTQLGPRRPPSSTSTRPATPPAGCSASTICARSPTGPATAARWWCPTSVTSAWAGTHSRSRCCTPPCPTATTPGCWPRTRCRRLSSLAGYRAGFVAGDPEVVAELLAVRKHAGMMMPTPVQAAMVAALTDDAHERDQRDRYARRRDILLPAVRAAGFTVDHSEAGLYLWATRGDECRDTVAWFAQRGILVAPGEFYGPTGRRHVRIALTATDERINAAAARLTA